MADNATLVWGNGQSALLAEGTTYNNAYLDQVRPNLVGLEDHVVFGLVINGGQYSSGGASLREIVYHVYPEGFRQDTIAVDRIYQNGSTQSYSMLVFGNAHTAVIVAFNPGTYKYRALIYQRGKYYPVQIPSSMYTIQMSNYMEMWALSGANRNIACVWNGSNIYRMYIPTIVDGLIKATVSAASSATLLLGVVKSLATSFTVGKIYKLKDEWSAVGDMAFKGTVPVARAIETNAISMITPNE